MFSIKYYLGALLFGLIAGAFLMFKLHKVEPKIVKDTKVVHDVKTIERVIKGKDGTVITEIVHETKTETKEVAKSVIPKVRIGLMGGYNFIEKRPDYGLQIIKPINQNVETSVYFIPNNKQIGVTASWGF